MVVDDFHKGSSWLILFSLHCLFSIFLVLKYPKCVLFFVLTYYLVLIPCGKVFSFIAFYQVEETLSCMYTYASHSLQVLFYA